MAEMRLGVGTDLFRGMESFARRPTSQEDEAEYQKAAKAVDVALAETMKYIREEQAGRHPKKTGDQLSALWQQASRLVQRFDPDLATSCYYKALGWIEPECWTQADQRHIETSLEAIQHRRLAFIQNAHLQAADTLNEPGTPQGPLSWIKNPETRAQVQFVGGGLVIAIGALWTAFVYFDGKKYVEAAFNRETVYFVCMGEKREECRTTVLNPNEKNAPAPVAWVPCGTNLESWAKTTHPNDCSVVRQRKLSDVSGNKCGYLTAEIRCTRR